MALGTLLAFLLRIMQKKSLWSGLLATALSVGLAGCAMESEGETGDDDKSDSLRTHRLIMQPTGSVEIVPSNTLPSPRYEGTSTVLSHTDEAVTIGSAFLESEIPGVFPDRIELVDSDRNLALAVEYRGPDTDWERLVVETPFGPSDLFEGVILNPADREVSVRWVIPGLVDLSGVENRVRYDIDVGRTQENRASYQYRAFVTPTWDAWSWDDGQEYSYVVKATAAGESEWIWGLFDWL